MSPIRRLAPLSASVAGATVMRTGPAWESAVRSGHRSGHTGTKRLQGPHGSYRRAIEVPTHSIKGRRREVETRVRSGAHASAEEPLPPLFDVTKTYTDIVTTVFSSTIAFKAWFATAAVVFACVQVLTASRMWGRLQRVV